MPNMIDVVLILLLLLSVGGAITYVVKEKKNGTKCIGCPASAACGAKKGGPSACRCGSYTEKRGEHCCDSTPNE